METCKVQNKKSYKYELTAKIALSDIMASKNKKRKEIRYYYCKYCHGYHLTSQPKRGKINHNGKKEERSRPSSK